MTASVFGVIIFVMVMTRESANSIAQVLKWGLCGLVLLAVYSFFYSPPLPEPGTADERLLQEPIQTSTERERFVFEKEDHRYWVEPKYNYEIWGTVVTKNMINIPIDVHNSREKDLCVIWGDNTQMDLSKMKFRSANFTCYISTRDTTTWKQFNQEQLSNNHLLASDPMVKKAISKANIGDQIYLKGVLANYGNEDTGQLMRKSSTVRNDTGNGACETIFVDEFEVLKASQPIKSAILKWSRWGTILFFVLNFWWMMKRRDYTDRKRH